MSIRLNMKLAGWRALALVGLVAMAPAAHAALGAAVTLKVGSPGTISAGQTTILQITLSNSSTTAAITGVGFSNSLPGTLPNGLKIAGAATYTCTDPAIPATAPGAGTLTAAAGTQSITLSAGSIPSRANSTDGTCVIEIPVTAGTSDGSGASYTYTIGNGAVTGNDGGAVANLGVVNQSINVNPLSRPVITKSFNSNTVILGGAATTLTITVTNANSVALPNFSDSDVFPLLGGQPIIKVAAAPASTSTCTGVGTPATFTPAAGDVSLSATGGTVAANGSCTMTVAVIANQTNGLYDTGLQTNTIDRTTQFSNDLGIVPATNATAQIRARSPLAISKAFAHSFLSTGQSDSFTITLTNNGSSALTVTTLDDDPIDGTVGTGFGLVATGGSSTCVGGAVSLLNAGDGIRLTGGVIPANGSCTVTGNFTGTVQTAGQPISYTNSIPAGAVGLVGAPPIVSQAASAAILVADDLRVLKTGSPGSVAPGNPVLYTVTVQNFGTTPINNVVVTDTFANGLTYLTGTVNGLTYTPSLSAGCGALTANSLIGDANAIFTIGTLPARANINSPGSCTVTFYAMSATGAGNGSSTANVIPVGGVCYAGPTCNAAASPATTGTVSTTVLSLAKAFNLASPQPEGTITRMTLTVTNQSANALTNVGIADTLPIAGGGGQMRVATPANASSTCGAPTITAVANSTSIAMSGGTVPGRASNGTGAAGTCFLQVDVIAGAGVYTNTATVTATETYANGATHALGPINANANFTYNSSLVATKSFSPAAVSSGGKSTVTVRLSNNGAVALTGVSVTDPLPGGMVLANPTNAYTTCAGPTSVTATAGASSVGLVGAAMTGNSNCDFIFDVVATGASNWTNTIPAGNITANGGISNQSAVAATLIFNAPNNPSVIKATNPSTLTFPGQTSQLTITVTNGTQAVTNLTLTDYFTADGTAGAGANGMVVAPTPAASSTCPGGIVTATPGGTSVALAGVSLAAGASCTVSLNVSSNKIGGITNFIPIGAIANDQGLSNAGQATTSLTTQSNIGITKQFTPNVVKPGERSRLRITFLNPTNQPLTALGVLDTLPAGVTVPAGPNPSTTCTGATVGAPAANQVQVSGGSIPAAVGGVVASCYAEIDVTVAAQGDYVNTIGANAITASAGGVPVTNSQPTSDTLRAKAPLTIHKAFSGLTLDVAPPALPAGFATGTDSKSPGTPLTMTVRLDNPNNVSLTGAAFTDTLPTGLVVATTPTASTTCAGGTVVAAASATQIRLAGATIPAAGFCTVTVNVLSNIPGLYTNTIVAGGVTTTEGVTNEESTRARVEISNPPQVSKQFAPAVIPPNGTSTLTIFLGNDNSTALTLTSALVDTLPTAPGNIVVKTPSVIGGTCTGTVTATAGSASVTYANGATIPAGGCTITVNVTGATAGVHTNNIPAGALKTNAGNNQNPANATLTISTLGYVSGKVFRDNNSTPNGTFESGSDTPIAGASIELHSGTTCSGPLVGSATTTDAVGNYLFTGLAAGNYSVCEPVQPTGTTNGITTAGGIVSVAGSGGTAGAASNPTATSSQIVNIQLTAAGGGEVSGSTNNNFAEVVPSSISGMVFLDQNDNGVQNAFDTALAGVQIELLNAGNAVVATTTTDASGNYSFTNLSPGTYSVREPTQPSGTANGKTLAGAAVSGGTAGTATAQNVAPSVIATIVLPPNRASTDNNFAEVPAGRQVAGRVFLDANEDGLFNGSDSGLSGVTLNLTGNDFNGIAVSRTIQTTADGRYVFTGLPESGAGGYTVTEPSQPGGTRNGITTAGTTGGTATLIGVTPSIISTINLAGFNTLSANNNFAEILVPVPIDRAISGKVFRDDDKSGTFNGSEQGIGGQTINLTGVDINGNAVTRSTTTAVDGTYRFTGLPEGTYTVSQPAQPVGTSNGTTVAGTTGGVASNPTASSSQIAGIDLKGGNTASINNDFAEIVQIVDVAPDLVVTKAANKTIFTEGNLGFYTLRVKNAGGTATTGAYTVTDSLPATGGTPSVWTIDSASGNGWACTVSANKLSVTCDTSAVLQPGMENPSAIAVTVRVASGAVAFGPLRNLVQVVGGGEPDDKKPKPGELSNPAVCGAAPQFNACYAETPLQRAAGLSGHVWVDGGLKKVLDAGDKRLPYWIVEIYDISDPVAQGKTFTELVRGGLAKQTFITDSQGYYEACNLQPNSTYRVLFRDPANRIAFPGVVTNEQGRTTGTDYWSQVKDREGFQVLEVNLPAGNGGPGCNGQGISAPEQSLPLDPNGVVYDSRTRAPVPGSKVTLIPEGICTGYDPKLHIINYETYAKDPQGNPSMTVGEDGFYKFLLSGDPTAPKSCQFRLALDPPAGFKQPPSSLIPPSAPLNTPAGPGIYEVQPQKPAPTGTQSTKYHFSFLSGLNHQEVFNNHLPLDRLLPGKLVLSKQGDKRMAEVGDTVLYTITVRLLDGDPLAQTTVRDRLPAGLTLVPGTVFVNGKPAANPMGGLGPVLAFNLGPMAGSTQATVSYRVRVGVGAMQGDGINRAQAYGCQVTGGCVDPVVLSPLSGVVASNEGQHKVEVTGGVFTDDACVLGKIFVDCNNNHVQDPEEVGIPGVRLYFSDGHFVVSDSEGKYSRCGIAPRSHVLTPDPSTLPKGSRLTTSSNRNLGDANSLFLDIKNGELHRADFIEGSCSNPVLEQVKARRAQGEVRSIETEKSEGPALRFKSKPFGYPQQGTDSANQPLVQPRSTGVQTQGASDAR